MIEPSTRPFTDDERTWIERCAAPTLPITPASALWRWLLCVGACSGLAALIVCGLLGQSRPALGLSLLVGGALGDMLYRVWIAASERNRQRLNAECADEREKWSRALAGGVMELRSVPVLRYATLDTGYDDLYLIQISASEVLCLFSDALDEVEPASFPGRHLELDYIPIVEVVERVEASGESQEPSRTLSWEDFKGFSSPDALYSYLDHGKIYLTSLDRIETELISLI
jgi:hypothetical protein